MNWRGIIRFLAGSLGLMASLSLGTGCSVGLFSDGKDQGVLQQKPYRPVDPACGALDIQNDGVSVTQFRGILSCLNSNGSLQPIEDLIGQMSDQELLPLVRVGNEQFFKNPVFLHQFEKTYAQWIRMGTIDADLDEVGGILRNQRFITSMLGLMAKADVRLYKALELISGKMDARHVEDFLETSIALIESPAMQSLSAQLKQAGKDPHTRQELAAALLSYIRAQREPGRVDVDRRWLAALASGKLFRVLDDFSFSVSPRRDLRETVSRLSALSHQLSAPERRLFSRRDSALLSDLMELVHGMHAPIPCLKSTQSVPDGVIYILKELSTRSTKDADRFLRRDNILNLALMNSFCEYPKALGEHYGAFQALASSDTLYTAVDFSKAFMRGGIIELLVDALGGEGVGPGINSSLPSPLVELLPIISELDDRGALEDLFLLLASIRVEDRTAWQDALGFISIARPELDGASIYDVFYNTLSNADEQLVAEFMAGVGDFIDQQQSVLGPAFASLRRSFLMNNVHPVVERVRSLLSQPDLNRDFFESIFFMARKWPREFGEALRFMGDMTRKSDGRLKEILGVSVRLFSRFAERGASAGPVIDQQVPILDPARLRAHSWSRTDIPSVAPSPLREWKGCDQLTPIARLDDYESSGHEELVSLYLQCVNSDGEHSELVDDVLHYLATYKPQGGKPLLHGLIDSIRSLEMSPRGINELVSSFFGQYDQGKVLRLVDLLPWWVTREFPASRSGVPAGTLVSPLVEALLPMVRDGSPSIRKSEKIIASALRDDAMPGALAHLLRLSEQKPAATPFKDEQLFEVGAFSSVLSRYECISSSSGQLRRAEQLVEDYRSAVVGAWLDPAIGQPPRAWDPSALKAGVAPLIDKLGDSSQGFLPEGLTSFLRTFTLRPGEAPVAGRTRTPKDLYDWLAVRADDWRVIPYFYPGETKPRAKVVSSLDLLELLVINADFKFLLPENYALRFLTAVAVAWGDEPRELWPPMIREMFPGRKKPPTLRDAYEEILGMLKISEFMIGYPKLPKCAAGVDAEEWERSTTANGEPKVRGIFPLWVEARVFNMRQLITVIEEGLPGASGPREGGMRILRDLLFELYQATPEDARTTKPGWANHLNFGIRLGELGAFRQISRGVRLALLPENQGSAKGARLLEDLVEGLVRVGSSPGAASMLRGLTRDTTSGGSGKAFVFELMDQGRSALQGAGSMRFGESVLYGLAGLRSETLANAFARNAAAVLGSHRSQVAKLIPDLFGMLGSDSTGEVIRAFSESGANAELERIASLLLAQQADGALLAVEGMRLAAIALEPKNQAQWSAFKERLDRVSSIPEYSNLRPGEFASEWMDFFTEEDRSSSQAARELRQYLADRCETGGPSALLGWMAEDPDGVRRMLSTVGKSSLNGELKEFLRMLRRALPDPRSLTSDALGLETRAYVPNSSRYPD